MLQWSVSVDCMNRGSAHAQQTTQRQKKTKRANKKSSGSSTESPEHTANRGVGAHTQTGSVKGQVLRVATTPHNTPLLKDGPHAEGSIKGRVIRVATTPHKTQLLKGCPHAEGSIKGRVLRVAHRESHSTQHKTTILCAEERDAAGSWVHYDAPLAL
jgi:hypothetical protein